MSWASSCTGCIISDQPGVRNQMPADDKESDHHNGPVEFCAEPMRHVSEFCIADSDECDSNGRGIEGSKGERLSSHCIEDHFLTLRASDVDLQYPV